MSTDVLKYETVDGSIPLDEWLAGLRDQRAKARMLIRLDRLVLGLEGHWRSVGEGIRELKISEGKGYRIYYAWDGSKIVLLLCGGNKSTQNADIENARIYWRDYNERKQVTQTVSGCRLYPVARRSSRVSECSH